MRRVKGLIFILGVTVSVGLIVSQTFKKRIKPSDQVDMIVVEKANRKLMLISNGQVLSSYSISLGSSPVGPKAKQGDGKTPEGKYLIDYKLVESRFYRALHISYPDVTDLENARIQGVPAGGDIEIHGLPSKWSWLGFLHRFWDWTDGCIAVTNDEIKEIWDVVSLGTPIQIKQ